MTARSIVWLWWMLAACSNHKGDPPPPVGSATLPVAPPRATGALAAGREAAMPKAPLASDPEHDEEEEDPGPLVPAPAPPPDDGGMAL